MRVLDGSGNEFPRPTLPGALLPLPGFADVTDSLNSAGSGRFRIAGVRAGEVGVTLTQTVFRDFSMFGFKFFLPVLFCTDPVKVTVGEVVVDLQIDSDNTNGGNEPDGTTAEDDIEESFPGKMLFVNHNDDDRDGVPDYSDTQVGGEGNLVPLVVEIRGLAPGTDLTAVFVTFNYDGDESLPDFSGQPIQHRGAATGFVDYREARQDILRLWNMKTPTETKGPTTFIAPLRPVSVEDLDFRPVAEGTWRKVFWIEAVGGGLAADQTRQTDIEVEVTTDTGAGAARDRVVATITAPNIGVNNSNGNQALRPGIPDVEFVIDDHDEIIGSRVLGGFAEATLFFARTKEKGVLRVRVALKDEPEDGSFEPEFIIKLADTPDQKGTRLEYLGMPPERTASLELREKIKTLVLGKNAKMTIKEVADAVPCSIQPPEMRIDAMSKRLGEDW